MAELKTPTTSAESLITEHLDIWTTAIEQKSSAGRGSSNKFSLYGIKKLRELILELAVRGKLVPQASREARNSPNYESASVLLERIAAEKAQLVKEGKLKKQKPLPEISEEEKPFELPQGWEFKRLGQLALLENGDRSKNYPNKSLLVESGIPFVNAGHLVSGRIAKGEMTFITDERFQLLRAGKFINNDILFCLRGSLGKSALVEGFESGAIASSLVIVRTEKVLLPKYLLMYFDSPLSARTIKKYDNGTAQPNLSAADLAKFLVPTPPLTEQHRIVAKVDELMGLCDALEEQTETSIAAHQTLVEVLLAALLQVPEQQTTPEHTRTQFEQNWQRVSEHFDTLFTTTASIDTLKQTILQLAVMGKLVPQNPNDEPAAKLLERIAAEKAQLIKEGKIKKQKPLPAITDEEKPFELPQGWEWCRFDDAALSSSAGWSPQCLPTPRNGEDWGVLKVSAVTWGIFNPEENKELPAHLEPRVEHEVQSGDFLISRANTADLVAKAVVVPSSAPKNLMMSDKIIRFKLHENVNGEYLNLMNNSQVSRDYYNRVAGGTSSSMKNVSREQIRSLVVALPPLKEQHRIVAKVDELMALCDQLKARLTDAQTTQLHLTDAIVEQAV
ncbi:restriction endonuclease subunit S [Pseudoalteromonas ulvae]|uniref:Restriction endonuclease subunit S n=1 Tax=Pseudoalteromonas ulvae TaxID=107327 RepID=A0A244CMN0_PSEDV|nr:restriction endonuclease subunit S [Pseudoalteromonas ulvae]OUL56870.1 restriction endonuclease subunit S [Pseudoalteromonas ulvae]